MVAGLNECSSTFMYRKLNQVKVDMNCKLNQVKVDMNWMICEGNLEPDTLCLACFALL